MWVAFFKDCMVSLIFLELNLLSLSTTFSWYQLKSWSASQQRLVISFLSQLQFLVDILCSFERDFNEFRLTEIDCLVVTAVTFIKNILFIFCSYAVVRFTREFRYWSVCVGFRYTNTEIFLLLHFNIKSRNASSPLFSSSTVNLILCWRLLM